MSKFTNGGTRTKSAREAYVEQLPYGRGLTGSMNKKRKSFTHLNSFDDTDFAYRSTPDYLRQLVQPTSSPPTEMMLVKYIPRTKSASELTPRNNLNRSMSGNPKYKAQEDYYDEIQILKKDMKTIKDENSNLRAKIRRLEEDNARKRKEIDALYDTSKDGDLRRTLSGSSTDRNTNTSTANVVMSLKQRLFKLELQLKQKETIIDEIKSDPKWTKSTELEIQNRALYGELEKQKIQRLNYIQQNDYTASVDEETKNAVRKLNREKDELKQENDSLKKKVQELEKLEHGERLSARSSDGSNNKELIKKIEHYKQECENYEKEIEHMKNDSKQMRRECNEFRNKFQQASEDLEEVKRDREQYRKKFEKATKDLQAMQHELDKQIKLNQTGRSSPIPKHNEDQHRNSINLSSQRYKRPQSPIVEKQTLQSSTTRGRRDSDSSDELSKIKSAKTPKADGYISDGENVPKSFQKERQENLDKKSFQTSVTTKSSGIQSPRSGSKADNLGSDNIRNRPSSANISNESALKNVQASLRGNINRTEFDKTSRQTSSPTPMEKSKRIGSDDDDDNNSVTLSKKSSLPYGSKKNQDSFLDQPKSNLKQSLSNNKPGSSTRFPTSDRESAPKLRRTPSPPIDGHRPSSPHVGSAGGSKQNLPNEKNKPGSSTRLPTSDRESAPKLRRTPSPPIDGHRPSSPHVGSAGGSKQNLSNEKNKPGSSTRLPASDRDSTSRLRHTPSPPIDSHGTSSPRVGSAGGSKQNLPNDRNKLGFSTRFPTSDRDSTSKLQDPSLRSDARRPATPPINDRRSSQHISPENSRPPSRKSPTTSKQSIKDVRNDDHDDDDDIQFS